MLPPATLPPAAAALAAINSAAVAAHISVLVMSPPSNLSIPDPHPEEPLTDNPRENGMRFAPKRKIARCFARGYSIAKALLSREPRTCPTGIRHIAFVVAGEGGAAGRLVTTASGREVCGGAA